MSTASPQMLHLQVCRPERPACIFTATSLAVMHDSSGTGSDAAERQVKEETSATLRCIPFHQPGGKGKCVFSGQDADEVAIFARSY